MTQSDIERGNRGASSGRGGMSWLWIALAIVLILLLAWWFWPDGTVADSNVTEPAGEVRIGQSDQPGADRADESTTSSDRTVAIPASAEIATRDVENVDASGTDRMTATSAGAAAGAAEALPVGEILDDPVGWSGRQVDGSVQVGSIATDQAFWINDGDNRLLALIVDRTGSQSLSIDSGRRLQVSDAKVHSSQDFNQNLTTPLDDDTRQLLDEQRVLLVISERNISMR